MDTEEKPYTFELTNGCICVETDQDTGEVALDKYGDPKRSDYCFDCFDEELDCLEESLVTEWRERNGLDESAELVVTGEGMNWNRVSGWAVVKSATAKEIVEALNINTEWRLDFRLEDKELTVVRYSHDEPTGTGRFRFLEVVEEVDAE
jgi:hypothetical protein